MNEEKRIVEINGVKLEVDLREATKIEKFKVGDHIKVLIKQYSGYEVEYGVIIDFSAFKNKPAIEVLSLSPKSWDSNPLKFHTITEDSEIEIAPLGFIDGLFAKDDILERIDNAILAKQNELQTLVRKKEVFLERFGKFFELAGETA